MTEKQEASFDDSEIFDKLHTAGNFFRDARGRQEMIEAGLELLIAVMAEITDFNLLQDDTKYELVVNKLKYKLPLSAEELSFARKNFLF
ncbi:MAG TPA: hypothetical protein DCW58_01825 [Candidatus Pacebacteria bacterium]|nr:hypothetical protein [Candidatus Paceibacterota bacterium]